MNCDECKELLSPFLDNELEETRASVVRAHLSLCRACSTVCEDLASLLDVCATDADQLVPPNSKAMWLRINNVIESEPKPVPPAQPAKRSWQFSFGQVAVALGCIALVSSVATVVAIREYLQPPSADLAVRSTTQTTFEKVLGKLGLMETLHEARERRIREQQAAIEYWNARVQSRRLQWDRATRDAFDRNLRVIDETVAEYTTILQQNPDDDLSSEMLDAVLDDKMNFLRDFSDL